MCLSLVLGPYGTCERNSWLFVAGLREKFEKIVNSRVLHYILLLFVSSSSLVHQPILLCTCCLRCYRLFAPELKLVLELGYLDDRGTSSNHTGNNPTTGGEKLILDWHFQCCTNTCNYNIIMPRSSNKLLCTLSPSSTQQESSHRLMKCQSSVP